MGRFIRIDGAICCDVSINLKKSMGRNAQKCATKEQNTSRNASITLVDNKLKASSVSDDLHFSGAKEPKRHCAQSRAS